MKLVSDAATIFLDKAAKRQELLEALTGHDSVPAPSPSPGLRQPSEPAPRPPTPDPTPPVAINLVPPRFF